MRYWLIWGLTATLALAAIGRVRAELSGTAPGSMRVGSTPCAGVRVSHNAPAVDGAAGPFASGLVATATSPEAPAAKDQQPVAWGKSEGDLQFGVRLIGVSRPYRQGDALELEVLLRNLGKNTVNCLVPYDLAPGSGNVPEVRNEKDDYVPVRSVILLGTIALLPHTIKPGDSEVLGTLQVLVHAPGENHPPDLQLRMAAAPGKYRLRQRESIRVRAAETSYYNLRSGTVDFVVANPAK